MVSSKKVITYTSSTFLFFSRGGTALLITLADSAFNTSPVDFWKREDEKITFIDEGNVNTRTKKLF